MPTETDRLKRDLQETRKTFLDTFAEIPDDRLDWRSAPTAPSAAEIARHVAGADRGWTAAVTRTGNESRADVWSEIQASLKRARTRAEILRALDSARAEVLALLEPLSPQNIEETFTMPGWQPGEERSLTVEWVLRHLIEHDAQHAGQLQYLANLLALGDPTWVLANEE